MVPDAGGLSRQNAAARATNSAFGILAASQSDGPTSSVEFIASMQALHASLRDRSRTARIATSLAVQRRARSAVPARRQIARLRQVLVRMDHEHHALREQGIV